MESTNAVINTTPSYLKPAARPTELTGFRIYGDQREKLTKDYDGKASALVRLLLDKFFRGELPDINEQIR